MLWWLFVTAGGYPCTSARLGTWATSLLYEIHMYTKAHSSSDIRCLSFLDSRHWTDVMTLACWLLDRTLHVTVLHSAVQPGARSQCQDHQTDQCRALRTAVCSWRDHRLPFIRLSREWFLFTAELSVQCRSMLTMMIAVMQLRLSVSVYNTPVSARYNNNNNNNNSRISIPPSVVTSEAVAEPVRSRKSAIVGFWHSATRAAIL